MSGEEHPRRTETIGFWRRGINNQMGKVSGKYRESIAFLGTNTCSKTLHIRRICLAFGSYGPILEGSNPLEPLRTVGIMLYPIGGIGEANPARISSGEITAGTETGERNVAPVDLVAVVDTHGAADLLPQGRFMVRKVSIVQASTSSWADLVSWAAADEIGSDFTFSAVSGILEINTTGDYEITYSILGTNTVANRASLEVRLMRDTGGGYAEVTNTKRGAYARLSTTHQFATVNLPTFHKALSDGDLLKLQIQHTGNVLNATGYIYIKRVG